MMILALVSSTQAGGQQLHPVLNDETAKKIVAGCEDFARENGLKVAVAVVGPGRQLKAFLIMDGAIGGAGDVAIWKARSSSLLGMSTGEQAKLVNQSPSFASVPGIAAVEGGEPIYTATDVLIGGVGVSGATGAQDAECARAGISAADQTLGKIGRKQ